MGLGLLLEAPSGLDCCLMKGVGFSAFGDEPAADPTPAEAAPGEG